MSDNDEREPEGSPDGFHCEPEDIVLLDEEGNPVDVDPDDPERFWDESWDEGGTDIDDEAEAEEKAAKAREDAERARAVAVMDAVFGDVLRKHQKAIDVMTAAAERKPEPPPQPVIHVHVQTPPAPNVTVNPPNVTVNVEAPPAPPPSDVRVVRGPDGKIQGLSVEPKE
jgi:hypothetical protein